jgi:peptidoglycan-N-acetylglucosamine deacetylase
MKLLISFDDGDELDRKMIELLGKYFLRGLFFVPLSSYGARHMSMYERHEVGGHTETHPQDLKSLDAGSLYREIVQARQKLAIISRQDVKAFCYPRGRYNEDVKEFVKMAGYTTARTTKVLFSKEPPDRLEQHTSVHIYPRKEYNGKAWLDVALDMIKTKQSYFHVWGHSREIDKLGLWQETEELFKRLSYESIPVMREQAALRRRFQLPEKPRKRAWERGNRGCR